METYDQNGNPVTSQGSPVSNNAAGVANSTSNPIKKAARAQNNALDTNTGPMALPTTKVEYETYGTGASQNINVDLRNRDFLTGYEDPLVRDIEDLRGQRQSGGAKLLKGVGRVGTKALAEIAKLPGLVGGGVMALGAEEGEGWNTFVNNEWIKSIQGAHEAVNNEFLPVYTTAAMRDGNLWDHITSAGFWATDGADGLGYILSMLAPGAALKSLGLGAKTVGGLSKGVAGASDLLGGGLKAEAVAAQLAKMGVTAGRIDTGLITMANTFAEAGAEAGGAMSNFDEGRSDWITNKITPVKSFLDEQFRNGEITEADYNQQLYSTYDTLEKQFNEQKGILGRDIFTANVGILALPNFIQTKLLFGATKGSFKIGAKTGMKESSKNFFKGFLGGVGSEGFFEEGLQTTAENMFTKSATKGELNKDGSIFNNFNISELINEYGETLTSIEGQKAIFLGAAFGGTMNGVGAMRQAKSDYQRSIEAQNTSGAWMSDLSASMANLYQVDDRTGNIVLDESNKPVINPIALAQVGETLGSNVIKSALFQNLVEGNTDESGNVDIHSKNTLDFLRHLEANEVATGFALNAEMGEEVMAHYIDTQRNAITNEESRTAEERTAKLRIFNDTVQVLQKQFSKAQNNSEAYDALSPALSLNTDQLQGKNKNQILNSFGQALKRNYVVHQGQVTLVKDLIKDRNKKLTQIQENLPQLEEGEVNPPAVNALIEEIELLDSELDRLNKITKDVFFNTAEIQKQFDENIVGVNNTMLQKEAKNSILTNALSQITNAKTIEEVNQITLEDELFRKEFDSATKARRKQINDALAEERSKNKESNESQIPKPPTEVAPKVQNREEVEDLMEFYNMPLAQANRIVDDYMQGDLDFDLYIENLENQGVMIEDYLAQPEDTIVEETAETVSIVAPLNTTANEVSVHDNTLVQMESILANPSITDYQAADILDALYIMKTRSHETLLASDYFRMATIETAVFDRTGLYATDVLGLPSDDRMIVLNTLIEGTNPENKNQVVNIADSPVIYKAVKNSNDVGIHSKALVTLITEYTQDELFLLNEENEYSKPTPDTITSEMIQKFQSETVEELTVEEPIIEDTPTIEAVVNVQQEAGHITPLQEVKPLPEEVFEEDDVVATVEYEQGETATPSFSDDIKNPRVVMYGNRAVTRWSENPVDKTNTPLDFKLRDGAINNNEQYPHGISAKEMFDKYLASKEKPTVDDMEFMVMYLPLVYTIPTELETLEASIDGYRSDISLDNSKENRPKGTYNSNSAANAMPLRFQMIDAMLNGETSFKPVITDQLGGALRINRDVSGVSINSNIKDIKLFDTMSPQEQASYLMYNLYHVDGTGAVVNAKGLQHNHAIGSKGDIFLNVPRANGKPFMMKLNQGVYSEVQADALVSIMQTLLMLEEDTSKISMNDFASMFTSDEYTLISEEFKPYFDIHKEIYGPKGTVREFLNLFLHNSANPKTKLLLHYGSLSVGSLFGRNNNALNSLMEGRTTLTSEDLSKDLVRKGLRDYIRIIRKNIKTKPLGNPKYLEFLINTGALQTNSVINKHLFGNEDRQAVTEVIVNHSLQNAQGDNYVASFDASQFKVIPPNVISKFSFDASKNVKEEVTPSDRNMSLFPEFTNFGKFENDVKLSKYENVNGVGYAQYSNPETESVDVFIAGTNGSNYVAYMRQYVDGKATDTFTSKMDTEGASTSPVRFKDMLLEVQKMLPEDHKYTEDVSVSTDGLRFFLNQLKHGYNLALDSDGNTEFSKVYINGGSLVNDLDIKISPSNRFNSVPITNAKDLNAVIERVTAIMKNHGIAEPRVYSNYGTVAIDLPVIQKSKSLVEGLSKAIQEDTRPITPNGQSEVETYVAKFKELDDYNQGEALLNLSEALGVEITEELIENLDNESFRESSFTELIKDRIKSQEFTKKLDKICGF